MHREPAKRVHRDGHRPDVIRDSNILMIDVNMRNCDVVVGRHVHFVDPPRRRHPPVRVTRRKRQPRRLQQTNPQPRLLNQLPQRGLLSRLVTFDMTPRNHVPAQPRMSDQAKPPALRKPAEHEHTRSRMLDHAKIHPLDTPASPPSETVPVPADNARPTGDRPARHTDTPNVTR